MGTGRGVTRGGGAGYGVAASARVTWSCGRSAQIDQSQRRIGGVCSMPFNNLNGHDNGRNGGDS